MMEDFPVGDPRPRDQNSGRCFLFLRSPPQAEHASLVLVPIDVDRLPEEVMSGVSEHLRHQGLQLKQGSSHARNISQLDYINNLSSTLSLFLTLRI